jgi:hypothetical protein
MGSLRNVGMLLRHFIAKAKKQLYLQRSNSTFSAINASLPAVMRVSTSSGVNLNRVGINWSAKAR